MRQLATLVGFVRSCERTNDHEILVRVSIQDRSSTEVAGVLRLGQSDTGSSWVWY